MTQQQTIVTISCGESGEYSIFPAISILDTGRLRKTGKTAQASG